MNEFFHLNVSPYYANVHIKAENRKEITIRLPPNMGYGTQVASGITVICAAFLIPMLTCTVSLFYEVAQMHMNAMDGMDEFKVSGSWSDVGAFCKKRI